MHAAGATETALLAKGGSSGATRSTLASVATWIRTARWKAYNKPPAEMFTEKVKSF